VQLVAQRPLEQFILVRVQAPEPCLSRALPAAFPKRKKLAELCARHQAAEAGLFRTRKSLDMLCSARSF
jgi:hypothetical protein